MEKKPKFNPGDLVTNIDKNHLLWGGIVIKVTWVERQKYGDELFKFEFINNNHTKYIETLKYCDSQYFKKYKPMNCTEYLKQSNNNNIINNNETN